MLPTPPLDYLVAYVVCFALGALWTMCVGCYPWTEMEIKNPRSLAATRVSGLHRII
ncbi:hypothetical protein R75461_07684 [Paraburkholderia nemoris]|nr:hypothetical protein R75461_07684 [Paraburkholderia nemoris]